MPTDLTTAAGVIAALVMIVGVLWREHTKADEEDRAQRDRFSALLDLSLQNNRDAIAAWASRDDTDAARHRRTDR